MRIIILAKLVTTENIIKTETKSYTKTGAVKHLQNETLRLDYIYDDAGRLKTESSSNNVSITRNYDTGWWVQSCP